MKKYNLWLISGDTGISSIFIFSVMTSGERIIDNRRSTPSDPDDFGRCYRLLYQFPEWKRKLTKLKKCSYQWKVFVEYYEFMEKLYLKEFKTGKCPELYQYMKQLGF